MASLPRLQRSSQNILMCEGQHTNPPAIEFEYENTGGVEKIHQVLDRATWHLLGTYALSLIREAFAEQNLLLRKAVLGAMSDTVR